VMEKADKMAKEIAARKVRLVCSFHTTSCGCGADVAFVLGPHVMRGFRAVCVGMTCLASRKRTSAAGCAFFTGSGSWQHHWKHNTCTACNETFEAPFSSLAVLVSCLRSCQSVFRF
jgi:hypothetical protein